MNKEKRKVTERWTDAGEEDLQTIGITNWHAVARDRKKGRRTVLRAKVHNGL